MATRKHFDGETPGPVNGRVSIHEDRNGCVTFTLEGYGTITMHSRHFWHWLRLRTDPKADAGSEAATVEPPRASPDAAARSYR